MAAQWDLTPQDVIDSPHLLVGTPGQIAEDLQGYRERYGISYWVVQDMQPFAQVLPPPSRQLTRSGADRGRKSRHTWTCVPQLRPNL